MTRRWSATTAISWSRWLDTRTVRPSAAQRRSSVRTQWTPSGSRPFSGSAGGRRGGVRGGGVGRAEPLAHAEGDAADPLAGDRVEADDLQELVGPLGREALG